MMDSSQSHLHRKPLVVRTFKIELITSLHSGICDTKQCMMRMLADRYVMRDGKEKLGLKDKAWVMKVEIFSWISRCIHL